VIFRLLLLALLVPAAKAADTSLLETAVQDWLGERDQWAFTQRAVEYDSNRPKERLERFDPSQAGDRRWTLLAIDGREPTEQERAAWAKKKFKKNRRRFDQPFGDYFDFNGAKVLEDTATFVRYEVPLRSDKSWLFPIDKLHVVVTVNKETRALERLTAHVREPFKVLLGIARILGGDVDLNFLTLDGDLPVAPETSQPTGSVRVTATRFGERVEFTWSDFRRVGNGAAEKVAAGQPRARGK
jgi:hypothetical protein